METTQEEIYSKILRAGRRTYFFDVRETKASDYYLTITESKKYSNDDGTYFYKKHKIYLYKEDFSLDTHLKRQASLIGHDVAYPKPRSPCPKIRFHCLRREADSHH